VKVTKELLEEQILKFFVSGNIAFNQADNEHFRTLMSFIPINNKPATSPGRTTLRARLSKYAKLSEEQLKELLKNNQSKISLALDCWSSKNKRGFLGMLYSKTFRLICVAVTCHWIDSSWELQDALLEFKHVPGHHTGEALADEVYNILEKYELFEKLFCITMDNASNNEKMMRYLSR